jgi:hypothetical protein
MSLESAGTVSFAHRCHLRVAPAKHHAKIRLFVADADVPDPYYGGAAGARSRRRALPLAPR